MSLVYGVTNLQCAVNADVALPQHCRLHLHLTLNKLTLLRIIKHQYDHATYEQLRDVNGSEHGVDVQAAKL